VILGIDKDNIGRVETIGRKGSLAEDMEAD
jgi:hypothetical protein